MSKKSRTECFYVYPKYKDGTYTGNTVCVILREGLMFHGEAVCSPKDDFAKKIGREISFARAEAEYIRNKEFRNNQPVQDRTIP